MRLHRIFLTALLFLGLSCWATIRQQAAVQQGNSNGSLAAATSAMAAKGGGKPTPTPTPNVTSTIFDTSSTGDPLLLQSDDLYAGGAPGYAAYSTSAITGVVSLIDGYNYDDWNLTLNGSTRGFYLTLNPVSGAAGLPSGTSFYSGRMISRCYDPTGATTNTYSWFNITGANPNCAMRLNFSYLGNGYTMVMSPIYPGTGKAEVYCNASGSSGSCADWTILPNLNAPSATIANLYSVDAHNGKETLVGAYHLTFRIHVTYP
jgi:hypothetical protein